MQNFFSNMAPGGGGEGGGPQSDVPWWMRYAGKGAGIGGGVGKWHKWHTICLVKSGRNYKTYFYLYSGSFLWILVLYLIFAPLHCGWYLADLCGSLRYHTRSSILLHVLGLCSTSSGQSGWQTSLAESSRVPSVRIFWKNSYISSLILLLFQKDSFELGIFHFRFIFVIFTLEYHPYLFVFALPGIHFSVRDASLLPQSYMDWCHWEESKFNFSCSFSLAIPPISMCFSLSTLIGSGLIFLASVVYGMQVLGPK